MKDNDARSHEPKQDQQKTLSRKISEGISMHFPELNATALIGYTSGQHHSEQPGAVSDIDIYDPSGAIVLQGREFRSNVISFWKPVLRLTVPEWIAPGPGINTVRPVPQVPDEIRP